MSVPSTFLSRGVRVLLWSLVAVAGAALRLRTWDRTVVPLPGSRVRMRVGPCLVAGDGSPDEEAARLRAELDAFFRAGGAAR